MRILKYDLFQIKESKNMKLSIFIQKQKEIRQRISDIETAKKIEYERKFDHIETISECGNFMRKEIKENIFLNFVKTGYLIECIDKIKNLKTEKSYIRFNFKQDVKVQFKNSIEIKIDYKLNWSQIILNVYEYSSNDSKFSIGKSVINYLDNCYNNAILAIKDGWTVKFSCSDVFFGYFIAVKNFSFESNIPDITITKDELKEILDVDCVVDDVYEIGRFAMSGINTKSTLDVRCYLHKTFSPPNMDWMKFDFLDELID